MTAHWLNTEQFWQAMCRRDFVRLSVHTGACGQDLYITTAPPGPEFVARVVAGIEHNLQIDQPHPIGYFMLSIAVPLMWLTLASMYGAFLWWLWK